MTMLADRVARVVGVDTHKHAHSAAVLDAATAGVLEEVATSANPAGYQALLESAERWGSTRVWAVEGTGGYGAGLVAFLQSRGEWVVELDRPKRSARRNGAKSDPLDAIRAGREALSRPHLGEPRAAGQRRALAALLAARRSAVKAYSDAQRQLHALVVSAPDVLRSRLRDCSTPQLLQRASRMRGTAGWDLETMTTAMAVRAIARRALDLRHEAHQHERSIEQLVRGWRPELLDRLGVGPIVAATVLCAWSHPARFRSEAAFAMLAGVAPIPASSGQATRHRLNRSGDRQLNQALHVVAIQRLRRDDRTRAYAQRRRAEGRTDREIRRCLKRYIARELYRLLESPPQTT